MLEQGQLATPGGTLAPDDPFYVERPADQQLLDLCRRGTLCYVLASRQMGKSSLHARAAWTLQAEGFLPVYLDLAPSSGPRVEAERWYLTVLDRIEYECKPTTDLYEWWDRRSRTLTLGERFVAYFREVLLPETSGRIVVFIDEIDSTLGLDYTDGFFSALRAMTNMRATEHAFSRVSFVLIGVATPAELIRDPAHTPFNIGVRVEVDDFGPDEATLLVRGIGLPESEVPRVVQRVIYWTGGQPFLTRRLCAMLVSHWRTDDDIDRVARGNLLGERAKADPHFRFISAYLAAAPSHLLGPLFNAYEALLNHKPIFCDDQSPVHSRLRLSGLAKRVGDKLVIRNMLYEEYFDFDWVRQQHATFWTRANKQLAAVATLAVVVALTMTYLWRQAQTERWKATNLWQRAQKAQAAAEEQARASRAGELAVAARSRMALGDHEIALLLAKTALAANTSPTTVNVALLAEDRLLARAVLRGHTNSVTSVSFSPDGQRILTASGDKTARLWGLDGKLLEELRGHAGWISSAAFSTDGARVVTAGGDNTPRLWSRDGQFLAELPGHTDWVWSATFSRDGRHIVTASNDSTARLWDLNGRPLAALGHGRPVWSAAFSTDSQHIVTASEDKTARVWDIGGNLRAELRGHTGSVRMAAFSPDNRHIVTASDDRTARIWNLAGRQLAELRGHSAEVMSAAFSPRGGMIVTASDDNTARLWNLDGKLLAELRGHTGWVRSVGFSPDGHHIVTTSSDNTSRVWDVDGKLLAELRGHTGWIRSAVFSPDGRRIVTASNDATVRLWDLDGKLLAELRGHTGGVSSAAFSADGRLIVTASIDKTARIWDVSITMLDANELARLLTDRINVLGLRFTRDDCQTYFSSVNALLPEECADTRPAMAKEGRSANRYQ